MPRKRQSTKSRIVKAAWNLFYKNGYEQTTVEDIIYASKTSKGTFYHYFKGKEALLNSLSYLFDEKYEELTAVIDPNLSAYDKLLFLNHELFYMIETSVDIKLLALLYSSQLVTKDKKSLSDSKRFYFKWITEILEEGLEKGEFKKQALPKNSWLYTPCLSARCCMTGRFSRENTHFPNTATNFCRMCSTHS